MGQDFQRIQRLPPYVFEQVNKLKAQARAQGALPDAVAEYLPDLMATMSVQPLAQMFKSYFPQISWYQIFRGNSTASAFNQGLIAAQLEGGTVCSIPKFCIWVCFC